MGMGLEMGLRGILARLSGIVRKRGIHRLGRALRLRSKVLLGRILGLVIALDLRRMMKVGIRCRIRILRRIRHILCRRIPWENPRNVRHILSGHRHHKIIRLLWVFNKFLSHPWVHLVRKTHFSNMLSSNETFYSRMLVTFYSRMLVLSLRKYVLNLVLWQKFREIFETQLFRYGASDILR